MNSFPVISRRILTDVFDAIVDLYDADIIKIIDSADLAFAHTQTPFVRNSGPIQPQIETIRNKVKLTANNNGRTALILLIEALYSDLMNTGGAVGVDANHFCDTVSIELRGNTKLRFSQQAQWNIEWRIAINDEDEFISIPLRKPDITNDIVPGYIIQYVSQSINAYTNKNYLASLALISIALEGTLRDALKRKGYTYTHGAQTVDSYELKDAIISANPSGYNVEFRDAMPRHQSDFLSESGRNSPYEVKCKRVYRNNRWMIELRDDDYLKDFWTSGVISQTGRINISGLGMALRIARDVGEANILDANILATDIDAVIQQVRNNLIHLSGSAMTSTIPNVEISLEDYAADQARVFDTITSICHAIDRLYSKIADGSI